MSIDTGYMTKTDFLPSREVLVWLDTCGIQWVGPGRDCNILARRAMIDRVGNFSDEFKETGNVVTTPGVLDEIWGCVKFYEKKKMESILLKKGKKYVSQKERCESDIESYAGLISAYNRMRKVLVDGVALGNLLMCSNFFKYTYKFVDNFEPSYGKKLSCVDKDLVSKALSSGDGRGLLTADRPMMEAYAAGSRRFGFGDNIVCNSIEAESVRAVDWEIL